MPPSMNSLACTHTRGSFGLANQSVGRSVRQENQSRERQSTIEHAAVNTAEMETRVDGRTTAMTMTETAITSTADDDDERRRGSIAVTWSRCKKLLLDFHFNSDRIFYWWVRGSAGPFPFPLSTFPPSIVGSAPTGRAWMRNSAMRGGERRSILSLSIPGNSRWIPVAFSCMEIRSCLLSRSVCGSSWQAPSLAAAIFCWYIYIYILQS